MLKRLTVLLFAGLISVGLLWAHGGNEHIMGTISAVNGDHVTIQTQDGKSEMVMLGKATKYFVGSKSAKAADMKVGLRVVVDAKIDPKLKMYSALEVKIGVAAPPAKSVKAVTPAAKHTNHN
jgi:hypothetical protein